MSDDPPHMTLPDDVQALLDAASHAEEPPPVDASARIWERLGETLNLPDIPPVLETSETPSAPATSDAADVASSADLSKLGDVITSATTSTTQTTFTISKVAATLWTAATFALGTATGVGAASTILTQDTSVPKQPDLVSPAITLDMDRAVDASQPDLSVQPDLGEPSDLTQDASLDLDIQAPPDLKQELPSTPIKAPKPASLEAERLLLKRAQTALARGDGDEALDVIRTHQRRYGATSPLAEERAFLRIRALLLKGEREKADHAVEIFKTRHPSSIFLDAINALP